MRTKSYNSVFIVIVIICICSNISLFIAAQETINTYYPYTSRNELSAEFPVFRKSGETILKRTLTLSDKLYHESPKIMIRLYIEKNGVLEPFQVNQVRVHRNISASPRSLSKGVGVTLDDRAYFQIPGKSEFSGLEYLMIEQGNYNPSYYIYKGLYSNSVYEFTIKNYLNPVGHRVVNDTFYIVTPTYTSSPLSYEYNIILNRGIDPPEDYLPVSISGQFVNKGFIGEIQRIQYDIYAVTDIGESTHIYSGGLNDEKGFSAYINRESSLKSLDEADNLLILCTSFVGGSSKWPNMSSICVIADPVKSIAKGDIAFGQIDDVYTYDDLRVLTFRLVGNKILDERIRFHIYSRKYPDVRYNYPLITDEERNDRRVSYFLPPGKYKVSVCGIGGKELKSFDIDIESNSQQHALVFDLEL